MAFAAGGLARMAHRRATAPADWAVALHGGQIAVVGNRLLVLPVADMPETAARLYLGEIDGRSLHAVDLPAPPALPAGAAFTELRAAMRHLPPAEAEAAATAKALAHWHRMHGFCSACGVPSVMAAGGWHRDCPACGTRHFPRTDPVVIMLVRRGDRALLGRSPGWRPGMYSCLAGFVEPGETLEAAVRREVAEETGVAVGAVRFVHSQPWPFPSSLMLGCVADALSDAITVDPEELEDAFWADRTAAARMMAGADDTVTMPGEGTIARDLILRWLADRLD
ncbi:NAD(+) diphosphatase [Falsirhodobacter halotolerans]|uniref:NAD(+) diphosphatase n=1 Tax=Falsirhodobacter halotolerans TaxID=1146892 RepID=UPI001FD1DF05|nr:NAD(+) diphosphatase [Falsirhodobacter halotolerans]MCJ8140403.1 NAD(+) diphosphatase [Falsirhodobacter halotolerans]